MEVGGPRSWFEQAGILICRPLKGSSCRLATAIIGNDNGVNHNHNDVGSYIVVLNGQVLIVDPGGETYTARTFGPHRYESNVLNSFGHSVPLVAGKMQDAGAKAKAVTLKTDFTDAQDTLVFDIRSAYSVPSLQKLTRTYVFSRAGAGSLTVTDDVAFSKPAELRDGPDHARPMETNRTPDTAHRRWGGGAQRPDRHRRPGFQDRPHGNQRARPHEETADPAGDHARSARPAGNGRREDHARRMTAGPPSERQRGKDRFHVIAKQRSNLPSWGLRLLRRWPPRNDMRGNVLLPHEVAIANPCVSQG